MSHLCNGSMPALPQSYVSQSTSWESTGDRWICTFQIPWLKALLLILALRQTYRALTYLQGTWTVPARGSREGAHQWQGVSTLWTLNFGTVARKPSSRDCERVKLLPCLCQLISLWFLAVDFHHQGYWRSHYHRAFKEFLCPTTRIDLPSLMCGPIPHQVVRKSTKTRTWKWCSRHSWTSDGVSLVLWNALGSFEHRHSSPENVSSTFI